MYRYIMPDASYCLLNRDITIRRFSVWSLIILSTSLNTFGSFARWLCSSETIMDIALQIPNSKLVATKDSNLYFGTLAFKLYRCHNSVALNVGYSWVTTLLRWRLYRDHAIPIVMYSWSQRQLQLITSLFSSFCFRKRTPEV